MPFSGGEVPVPNRTVHDLTWECLHQYGNATCIVDAACNGKSITFMELHDFSKRVAAYLQSWGIEKGDFVSICAPACLEFAYVMIGILGSGAVVAPCNPFYTKSEIFQQFNISRPRMVFVDEESIEAMKSAKANLSFLEKIVVIGKSAEFTTVEQILLEANPETLKVVDIYPEKDAAFAPHSSGTTGLPKCAIMTHRAYVAFFTSEESRNDDKPLSMYCDRPMYHTGGFAVMLANALMGIITVVEKECRMETMLKNIERYKINLILTVPSILIEMVNATDTEKYDLSSLIMVIAGGAAISSDIIRRIMKKYKVIFRTVYGMTEVISIAAGTTTSVDRTEPYCKVRKGVKIKITDIKTEEECRAGSIGEIRVRSAQVMKEYLSNPAANDIAFDQNGWFKTGDIGHLDEHGELQVVDRMKEIIKYKTVQVSPAELESVIIRHAKVADVGVVGIPDEQSGEIPKAFVVPSDHTLTVGEVHATVKDHLVGYKHLRGGVEFVSAIPKSATGKIQRNVLKKMAGF